jgi:hypothetical protein
MMGLLAFIPAFIFAAYAAWLLGQTLERITPLAANNEEA